MTLDEFESYAEENLEENTTVGDTTIQIDSGIVTEIKESVRASTNKDVRPVIESILLEELDREDEAQDKLDEFQENMA